MTGKDATGGGFFPAAVHAVTGGGHRRRAEIVAGAVLGTLSLMVVVGWRSAPGESGQAVGNQTLAPTPPHGDGALTYTAVTASGSSDAVTASILAFMIAGAALIGLFFYSPTPLPKPLRRPRLSGAAVTSMRRATTGFVPVGVTRRVRPEVLACLPPIGDATFAAPTGPQKSRGGGGAYSSMAPGAVLETVIRNSTLLLVFFNRSTSRSIA